MATWLVVISNGVTFLILGWVKSFFGRRLTAEQKVIDIAISRLDRCKNVAHLNVHVWHLADVDAGSEYVLS